MKLEQRATFEVYGGIARPPEGAGSVGLGVWRATLYSWFVRESGAKAGLIRDQKVLPYDVKPQR